MPDPSPPINPIIAIWKILKAAGVSDDRIDQDSFALAAAHCEESSNAPGRVQMTTWDMPERPLDKALRSKDGAYPSDTVEEIFRHMEKIPDGGELIHDYHGVFHFRNVPSNKA